MIGRLPIRVRLTLAFTVVMTLVLGATGAFLYLRFASELDAALDARLSAEIASISLVVREGSEDLADPRESPLTERGESYAQILSAAGQPLDATPRVREAQLLSPAEVGRALRRGVLEVDRPEGAGVDESLRVRGRVVAADARKLVAVTGVPLEERDEALGSLAALLLIGGPTALLLASVAGYAVAAGALRPVEAMRLRAAGVLPEEPGRRLPVSPARDELARLGETLNEMLGRQEAAFARERGFVSDASHELRTPLGILKTEIDLALRGTRSAEELLAALRSAREETDRLVQLAEDLLVITRSDEGRLPVRLERVNAREALALASERFRLRFADAGRELTVEAPEGLELTADRLRLEQAAGNLLENALQHGGGMVRLWADGEEDEVRIHVADEGGGFPPGFLPSAFERFSRVDQARSGGGAGLGLAIVQAIARAHGGRAHAENREMGTEVWLALPVPLEGPSAPERRNADATRSSDAKMEP
ncbi:MAG: sensor histidine kinase [Thermoleophilaceae bacterium]